VFEVWWKRQDEWKKVFAARSFYDAEDFALNKIVHGNSTQRIEIREHLNGAFAIFDRAWIKEKDNGKS